MKSLRDLIDKRWNALTPEQQQEMIARSQERMRKFEESMKHYCDECGCPLCPYGTGHSFQCRRRGAGY